MPSKVHGTLNSYRMGCRCEPCNDARAAYDRARKSSGKSALALVEAHDAGHSMAGVIIDDQRPHSPGRNERAVIAECEQLSTAGERPGMVEQAVTMAQILDSSRVSMHPNASKQLTAILNSLRDGARKKSKGRLASVQALTTKQQAG